MDHPELNAAELANDAAFFAGRPVPALPAVYVAPRINASSHWVNFRNDFVDSICRCMNRDCEREHDGPDFAVD